MVIVRRLVSVKPCKKNDDEEMSDGGLKNEDSLTAATSDPYPSPVLTLALPVEPVDDFEVVRLRRSKNKQDQADGTQMAICDKNRPVTTHNSFDSLSSDDEVEEFAGDNVFQEVMGCPNGDSEPVDEDSDALLDEEFQRLEEERIHDAQAGVSPHYTEQYNASDIEDENRVLEEDGEEVTDYQREIADMVKQAKKDCQAQTAKKSPISVDQTVEHVPQAQQPPVDKETQKQIDEGAIMPYGQCG